MIRLSLILTSLLLTLQFSTAPAKAQGSEKADQSKPNILVIWGDDVGQSNISAYSNRSRVGAMNLQIGLDSEHRFRSQYLHEQDTARTRS